MMASELGYTFYPYEDPDAPGHPRLDVRLAAGATHAHFDPQQASFAVATPEGRVEHVHVGHPWRWERRYRACAGRVVLRDRGGKEVEAFTLGGELEIASAEAHTTCSLKSPAPIFELTHAHTTVSTLVNEFEALLAGRHAAWHGDDADFEARLVGAEPLALYAAALRATEARLEQLPAELHDEAHWAVLQTIRREVERLKAAGDWPASPHTLEELL